MPVGISSIDLNVAATKPSRSSRKRAITACPSMAGSSAPIPNVAALRTLFAAFAAAIKSFEGMQPTVVHVVPAKPSSISRVLAPAFRAARSATNPAVPAPITATSQRISDGRVPSLGRPAVILVTLPGSFACSGFARQARALRTFGVLVEGLLRHLMVAHGFFGLGLPLGVSRLSLFGRVDPWRSSGKIIGHDGTTLGIWRSA
jgi:hypothetical protein